MATSRSSVVKNSTVDLGAQYISVTPENALKHKRYKYQCIYIYNYNRPVHLWLLKSNICTCLLEVAYKFSVVSNSDMLV